MIYALTLFCIFIYVYARFSHTFSNISILISCIMRCKPFYPFEQPAIAMDKGSAMSLIEFNIYIILYIFITQQFHIFYWIEFYPVI